MPTSFIKKDYTSEEKKIFPSEIFIFSVAFLILSLVFYGVVLYQQSLVKNQTAEIRESIARIDAARDKDKEKALLAFSGQTEKLSAFLKSRIYISKFLGTIEKEVHPQVVFSDFSIDASKRSFELKGQAASYGILARQMFKLEGAPVFSDLGLYNTVVQFGGVSFVFRGFLDPTYLK